MRVGQRLGLGFGIILVLMIGTVFCISFFLHRISETQKTVAVHTSNRKNFKELREHIEYWLITVKEIVKERDISHADYHEQLETSIEKKIKDIELGIYEKDAGDLLNEIVRLFHRLGKLDTTMQRYPGMGKDIFKTIKMDEVMKTYETGVSRLTKVLAVFDETITLAYKQAIAYSKKVEKNCWLSTYIVVAIAVIFCIVYAYRITRYVTKPLNLLSAATKKIANGSYDIILRTKSSAEIEELFNAFNTISLKLNTSNRKLAQTYKTIKEQKEFFDTILSNTKDMIFIMNKENKIEYMNNAASNEYGYAVGRYCYDAICNRGTLCHQCGIKETLKGQTVKMERTIQGKVYDSIIVPFVNGDMHISKLEILRDITERKQLQDELERLSITDKLTGLYNRRYFDDILEKEVLRARRHQHNISLLFIDIDKFKHFNDTYGHAAGDKVLQRLGNLVTEQIRKGIDIPCRYGGEEFTIILPETTNRSAITIANRILNDFRNIKFRVPLENKTIQKTISIGIAELGPYNNAKALLVNADEAMYKAKKLGGNRVCEYEFNASLKSAKSADFLVL